MNSRVAGPGGSATVLERDRQTALITHSGDQRPEDCHGAPGKRENNTNRIN